MATTNNVERAGSQTVQEIISQLNSGHDVINNTIRPEDVWMVVPPILDWFRKKYEDRFRSGRYELEVRVGKSTSKGFEPGVTPNYFAKVRHTLQKFKGWYLGVRSGVHAQGLPESKINRTLVFENRVRVRVPMKNNVPVFNSSEVMQKSTICKVTLSVTGLSTSFRIGVAEEQKLPEQRRYVSFSKVFTLLKTTLAG